MKSIDELREALARQILELALEDPNAQFKLDSYKATARPASDRGKVAESSPADGMAIFRDRVKKAELGGDGADEPA